MTSSLSITLSLRVLLVEDSPTDAELVQAALRRGGHPPAAAARVDTREEFLQQLALGPDIILCDYNMPNFSAMEVLTLVKQQAVDVPVIIISGSIGEETAVELIKLGAEDYLLKDRLGRLGPAVERALEQKKLRAEARRAEEELRESEFKYRCLFDHLFDAAYLCNATTLRIIDTNLQGERLLARDRAAIMGTRLGEFLPKATLGRLLALKADAPDPAVNLVTELDGAGGHLAVQVSAKAIAIHHHQLLLVLVRTLGTAAGP